MRGHVFAPKYADREFTFSLREVRVYPLLHLSAHTSQALTIHHAPQLLQREGLNLAARYIRYVGDNLPGIWEVRRIKEPAVMVSLSCQSQH